MTATMTELETTAEAARIQAATAYQALAAAKLATAVRTEILWDKTYDKYGRPSIAARRYHWSAAGELVGHDRDIAVVVTLPKLVRQETPSKGWLLNIRPVRGSGEYRGTVTYHPSRKAAVAAAEAALRG